MLFILNQLYLTTYVCTCTVKSQLETALKYKPPLNSNRGFDVTLKNELETALEL